MQLEGATIPAVVGLCPISRKRLRNYDLPFPVPGKTGRHAGGNHAIKRSIMNTTELKGDWNITQGKLRRK